MRKTVKRILGVALTVVLCLKAGTTAWADVAKTLPYTYGFENCASPEMLYADVDQFVFDDPVSVTGDLMVVRPAASTELTYVAIRNGNTTQDDIFSFTVYDGDGVTYEGSKTIPAAALSKGFVSAKSIAMDRLEAELSSVETTTAL